MEELLKTWDGESLVIHHDRPTGAKIYVAIHSTKLGPAAGGTRMKSYPSSRDAVEDALRLARGMSYKFAAAGMDLGGGKCVIDVPNALNAKDRPGLLRRYGVLVKQLGGWYATAPDSGTSSEDMNIISETGAPHVFCRTEDSGGAGDPGPFTAFGVFAGMKATAKALFGSVSLKGKSVVIQGVGAVGMPLIEMLLADGAQMTFTDVDKGSIAHCRDVLKLPFVAPEDVYDTACDIFAPCAMGAILNGETIARLRCKAVVGSANNQLREPEDAMRLHQRKILYAPDYLVNAGGVLGIWGVETQKMSATAAKAMLAEKIESSLTEIFEISKREQITPDAAAARLAEKRLKHT